MRILEKMGIDEKQIVVLSIAGSHLYGTATEESDTDYLGVYIPSKRDILLNRVEKQKSLKEDGIDVQVWSIDYFLKLACQGETMAIDLLHSPCNCWICFNESMWNYLQNNRRLFYTKNMKSFVSYARKQAAKYGVKGDRIKTLQTVINYLENFPPKVKLKEAWEHIPNVDHVHFIEEGPFNMVQVNGKKYQETVTIEYILNGLNRELEGYGKRAKLAAENKGIDWKAISHAIRGACQVYDILKDGTYTYPLTNAKFLTNVKLGKISRSGTETVLDGLLLEIDKMTETSDLPEEVNKEEWDNWLYRFMKIYIKT